MSSYEQLSPPADPAAGWKIDPLNPNQYRWWSGEGWTEHAGVSQPQAAQVPEPLLRSDIDMASRRMHITAGAKREIARLAELVAGQERVFEMCRGNLEGRTGLLALTEQRLLFLSDDKSSSREQEFPLASISGLSLSGGVTAGTLVVGSGDRQFAFTDVAKSDGNRLVACAQRLIQTRASAPVETASYPAIASPAIAETAPAVLHEKPADTGTIPFQVLRSADAFWRRSNQMNLLNTDLAKQLGAETLGARLWRIEPGKASTRHRHRLSTEVYVLLEGVGKLRIGDHLVELMPMDSVRVGPECIRQPFNDTNEDQLWLVFGAPVEAANTMVMSEEELSWYYPDGPAALPPELA